MSEQLELDQPHADVSVLVRGEPVEELPQDLYIPPDALEVIIETFSGPLDLLLYLIRRQNLDIAEVSVSLITDQYLEYIGMMDELRFDLAAEYLVMAAWLAEIKSRMLLPKPPTEDGEEDDPRAELVRRLQEYALIQAAAANLDAMPRMHRDYHPASARPMEVEQPKSEPPELKDLILAFADLLQRAELTQAHQITSEPLSVRERMSRVLDKLAELRNASLFELWETQEGKKGLVVLLLATLELVKNGLVILVQEKPFEPIELSLAGAGR